MKVFNDEQFDERQLFERGKAFRNAYVSMLLVMAVILMVNSFTEKYILDMYSSFLIPLWVSVSVFTCTAIMHDAYESYKNSCGYIVPIILGILGIITLGYSVYAIFFEKSGYLDKTEFINSQLRSIFQGVSCLIIFFSAILKRKKDKE